MQSIAADAENDALLLQKLIKAKQYHKANTNNYHMQYILNRPTGLLLFGAVIVIVAL